MIIGLAGFKRTGKDTFASYFPSNFTRMTTRYLAGDPTAFDGGTSPSVVTAAMYLQAVYVQKIIQCCKH